MLWRTSYYAPQLCCMHYGNDTVWLVNSKNQLNYRPPQHTKITDNNVCTDELNQSQLVFCGKASHGDQSERGAFAVEPFFLFLNNRQRFVSLICLLIRESLMQQGFPRINMLSRVAYLEGPSSGSVFFSSHRKPSLPGTFTQSKALGILQTRAMSWVISKSKGGLPRASSYTWISEHWSLRESKCWCMR